MLTLFDTRVRQFTEEEISLLTAFADQASLALEKARLLNDAEREKERSEALYRVSNLLAGAHDTDEVLDLIVNEAARLVGAPAAFIRLLEDDVLVPSAATQSAACYLDETGDLSPAIEVGERANLMGRTMAARNSVITEDALEEAPSQLKPLIQKYGFHGRAIIPLVANDQSIGVLLVYDHRIEAAGGCGRIPGYISRSVNALIPAPQPSACAKISEVARTWGCSSAGEHLLCIYLSLNGVAP